MCELSIIIPVYGCKECLFELYHRTKGTMDKNSLEFELIFINDASLDNPWELLEELCKRDERVKALSLSRNFGQHYAITAGLENAKGNWIVVMDCDLQDQPEEIPKLLSKAHEGYDIVLAQRKIRQDNFIKKLFSKLYYKFLGYLTDTRQDHTVANFGVYHRRVITSILQMKDAIRYFPAMIRWVGFSTATIEVHHSERITGKTSYNLKRLLQLGTNVVLSFSEKPLRLVVRFGLIISVLSFFASILFLYKYFTGQVKVLGFTSLILSIWFFSGIIIFILGIIGLYLGKTFDRVKNRPVYIIDRKINI